MNINSTFMIRKLAKTEYPQAIELSLAVFTECGKADYDEEGLETFKSFIGNEQLMDELTIYGAFCNNELVGIMGSKNEGKHISLFFIKPIYHRRGIGRKLFDYAYTLNGLSTTEITVNASTYAVPFYESLGFQPIGDAQCYHGLTSIPMKKGKQP